MWILSTFLYEENVLTRATAINLNVWGEYNDTTQNVSTIVYCCISDPIQRALFKVRYRNLTFFYFHPYMYRVIQWKCAQKCCISDPILRALFKVRYRNLTFLLSTIHVQVIQWKSVKINFAIEGQQVHTFSRNVRFFFGWSAFGSWLIPIPIPENAGTKQVT